MSKKRYVEEARHLTLDGCTTEDPLREPLMIANRMRNDGCTRSVVSNDNNNNADLEQQQQHQVQQQQQQQQQQPNTSAFSLRYRHSNVRILDRDAPFNQSRGRWRVEPRSRGVARHHILPTGSQRRLPLTKQFWDDWFYSLAYQRTVIAMIILFMVYAGIVFVFAFVYLGVSTLGQKELVNPDGTTSKLPFCDMDINDHMEALYFSLSTMTTIGYGVSDYYFGGCWTPLILVLSQACCAIAFDAVAIGLLFQRISRGHKRGKTIVFSDTAVIQRVGGMLYLMFRIGELRRHQLRSASVRVYCVRHERHCIAGGGRGEQQQQQPQQQHHHALETEAGKQQQRTQHTTSPVIETTHFITRSMKVLHEKVGSDVLMSLPQVIVHRVDSNSPLYQPPIWYDADGEVHERTEPSSLWNNTQGSNRGEEKEEQAMFCVAERQEMEQFLTDRQAEIVVLVEGIDELTGAIIQSRHSYTPPDLSWDHAFVPCVFPTSLFDEDEYNQHTNEASSSSSNNNNNNWYWRFPWRTRRRRLRCDPVCVVDFAAFHSTRPAPDNVASSPYVY